jgi:arsenate reductase-like glutaredoxin family protein
MDAWNLAISLLALGVTVVTIINKVLSWIHREDRSSLKVQIGDRIVEIKDETISKETLEQLSRLLGDSSRNLVVKLEEKSDAKNDVAQVK